MNENGYKSLIVGCAVIVAGAMLAIWVSKKLHRSPARTQTMQKYDHMVDPERADAISEEGLPTGTSAGSAARDTDDLGAPTASERPIDPDVAQTFRTKQERPAMPLDALPRSEIAKSTFLQVRGVFGSLTRLPNAEPLAAASGFYFYDSATVRGSENTVFDPQQSRYGVWSGEIVVYGKPEILSSIPKQFDLAIVREQGESVIFRAGSQFGLQNEYARLKGLDGVQEIRPDIAFGKQIPL